MTSVLDNILRGDSIKVEVEHSPSGPQLQRRNHDESLATENTVATNPTYSSFTNRAKWQIVLLSTFTTPFSPL
jgi:hypothetical protein